MLWNKGEKVLEQEFTFPDAARQSIQHMDFKPTLADQIEIYFSDPVVETVSGQKVPAGP